MLGVCRRLFDGERRGHQVGQIARPALGAFGRGLVAQPLSKQPADATAGEGIGNDAVFDECESQ